jgi:hypothetical protein
MVVESSHVLTRRKTSVLTPARATALAMAVEAIRGVPAVCPLYLDGEPMGFLRSDHTGDVWHAAGISDMVVAYQAGQTTRRSWVKQIGALSPLTLKYTDLWCVGGKPQAGTYTGTAATSRAFDDTVAGGLAHGGNVSPKQKFAKEGWIGSIGGPGVLWLYDRVLTYESCAVASGATTLTTSATAARYNGSGLPGLLVMPTIQTAMVNGPAMTGMAYTNQAGASKIAPLSTLYTLDTHVSTQTNLIGSGLAIVTTANNPVPFLPLAAGDTGVRSITSFTCNGVDTGTLCMAMIRPLVLLANSIGTISAACDFVHQMPGVDDIIYDGAHLSFLAYIHTAAQQWCMGSISFGWM